MFKNNVLLAIGFALFSGVLCVPAREYKAMESFTPISKDKCHILMVLTDGKVDTKFEFDIVDGCPHLKTAVLNNPSLSPYIVTHRNGKCYIVYKDSELGSGKSLKYEICKVGYDVANDKLLAEKIDPNVETLREIVIDVKSGFESEKEGVESLQSER